MSPRPTDRRAATHPAVPETRLRGAAWRFAGPLLAALLALPSTAAAQPQLPDDFEDQFVMGNLFFPVGMSFLPDGRLVVVERSGTVRLVVEGKLGAVDPLLTVDSVRIETPRQGLLGVAVDVQWPQRPYVYFAFDALDSTLRVSRYTATGDLTGGSSVNLALQPGSRHDVLRAIPDTLGFNACGALRFGTDGMLYFSLGDRGDACATQDTAAWRGVVLRLDVSGLPAGPGGPPDRAALVPPSNPFADHPDPAVRLVWTLGLRNPFRFHVDPFSGALFVADVGEASFEEIDRIASGGQSCGWPHREGLALYEAPCDTTGTSAAVAPIHVYAERSPQNEAAVIGAGVYRTGSCGACNFPTSYNGSYFFADYYSGFLRRLVPNGGGWQIAAPVPGQPNSTDWALGLAGVSDFLVGPEGALWYCRNGDGGPNGEIHRIVHVAPFAAAPDGGAGIRTLRAFPSPAAGRVRFAYTLAGPTSVDLDLIDLTGRRVRRLASGLALGGGNHFAEWNGTLEDGRPAMAGIYRIRLRAGDSIQECRFALVR